MCIFSNITRTFFDIQKNRNRILVSALIEKIRGGVIHIEYFANGTRIASGSGFICHGHLITNHHVFLGPSNSTVRLSWQPTADITSIRYIEIPYVYYSSTLVSGSDEQNFDFAILKIKELQEQGLFEFELERQRSNEVGDEIMILGFPFEHENLTCHFGRVSSFYKKGLTDIIQIDASVNQSNSGGPLVDIRTGKVIGLITRKGTGLSKIFDDLLNIFDHNVKVLSVIQGSVAISGVDLVGALISAQNQMKALAKEIERSSNVGIGYAFSIEHLCADNAMSEEA